MTSGLAILQFCIKIAVHKTPVIHISVAPNTIAQGLPTRINFSCNLVRHQCFSVVSRWPLQLGGIAMCSIQRTSLFVPPVAWMHACSSADSLRLQSRLEYFRTSFPSEAEEWGLRSDWRALDQWVQCLEVHRVVGECATSSPQLPTWPFIHQHMCSNCDNRGPACGTPEAREPESHRWMEIAQ